VWKGPLDGVSQSLINKFLGCPFRFYLYSILGVQDDRPPNLNLIWGNAFHKGLEKVFEYYKDGSSPKSVDDDCLEYVTPFILADIEKMSEGAQIPNTVLHSIRQMLLIYPLPQETGEITPEITFCEKHPLPSGREVTFRGKIDGLGPTTLIEHKCKGKFDALQTLKETPFDLQTTLYCWFSERQNVVYDLIRIPEAQYFSPKPTKDEKPENFTYRIFNNYCGTNYPIRRYRKYWIDQLNIPLPRSQQEQTFRKTIEPLVERMWDWYQYVTQPGFDIENPIWYNSLFYQVPIRHFDAGKTEFYKCDYWDYLVGDQDLDCLPKVKSYFTELEEE